MNRKVYSLHLTISRSLTSNIFFFSFLFSCLTWFYINLCFSLCFSCWQNLSTSVRIPCSLPWLLDLLLLLLLVLCFCYRRTWCVFASFLFMWFLDYSLPVYVSAALLDGFVSFVRTIGKVNSIRNSLVRWLMTTQLEFTERETDPRSFSVVLKDICVICKIQNVSKFANFLSKIYHTNFI